MKMKLHEAYQIDGVPILGLFRVRTLEDLQMAHEMGFNLATSVNPEIFDPSTPMGRYALENGFKGMYSITGPAHTSPRLSVPVSADATTISFDFGKRQPDPGPGVAVIEGERIRYEDFNETELLGCERGADGTQASAHRDGIVIFWPEPLAADIERVKDSPNLWGYWALDDTPGNVRSLMQGLTQTVHEVDGKHPVSAGFNSPDAMTNFGPGVCDALVLYWYPSQAWEYNRQMTSLDTQAILSTTRKIERDIPFIGLYQAFWGGRWNKPAPLTAFEIREQAEDFVREGAAGLMAYANLKDAPGYYGFNLDSEMARAVRDINEEVRATGGLDVRPERPEMAAVRMRAIGLQGEEPEIPGVPPAWHVASQFDVVDSLGVNTILPPDEGIDLGATYTGKDDAQVKWEIVPTHTGTVAYFGDTPPSVRGNDTVIFAVCTLSSPVEQTVQLRLGCGEDMLVRVNGRVIIKYVGARGVHMDENIAFVTLPAGESEILMKTHHRLEGWGFTLRLTDVDGRPLEGVTFSPTQEAGTKGN
jgi:hypothetical protein